MVDCRPGAGAPPHELAHTQPNGGAPNDNHHNQQAGGSGDMAAHGMTSPAPVRSTTPAATNTLATYTNAMHGAGASSTPGYPGGPVQGAVPAAPYGCGVKSLVWCGGGVGPIAPHVPPPPHGVNPHVFKSVQANGADLPMNDIPTLRYYYNLGVECMWSTYGAPPPQPPRHYSPRDLAQDISQMSLHERPALPPAEPHKHKGPPGDKPPLNSAPKGNGQRPLLGPRFKRGGNNQDGNQNPNHNQNKHNNNMGNKGPNNRRNSHTDGRNNGPHMGYSSGGGEGECVMEPPMLTLPYIPYPPPMYPIQYYPVETDPGNNRPLPYYPVADPSQYHPMKNDSGYTSPIQPYPMKNGPGDMSPVQYYPMKNGPGQYYPMKTDPANAYPVQYYPVEGNPAMMGMMGGMGYVGYEEGVEFGMQPYYPHPPHYPPPHPHPHPHHPLDHK